MNLEQQLAQARVGEPGPVLELDSRDDCQRVALALAEKARYNIVILSRHLDPSVFNTPEFADRISAFVREKRATLRVLVADTRTLIKQTHRLGELAVALSSKLEIRQLGPKEQDYNEAFMLVDGSTLWHLPQADLYRGSVDFYTPRRSKETLELFDSFWAHARLIPELRALKI